MEYEQILEGLKEHGFYNFMATDYYKLTKEELKDIILELAYASEQGFIRECGRKNGKVVYNDIEQDAIEELEDRWS